MTIITISIFLSLRTYILSYITAPSLFSSNGDTGTMCLYILCLFTSDLSMKACHIFRISLL
jgi:hypothetical protein